MSDRDPYAPGDVPPAPAGETAWLFGRFRQSEDGGFRDRVLDRPVALRCVSTAEADDLQAEARFLGRLLHPGLPCVYEFVRDDSGAALVTQPIVGRSLGAAVVARAKGQTVAAIADPTSCALTFIKLCDALGAAHLRGVVHCAISPEVIILGDDGQVVIENWRKAMAVVQRPLTMRFCANAPVQADLPVDDLQQDIRAFGDCLHLALVGEAPSRDAEGRLVLDQFAAGRIPRPLQSIIRLAVTSSAATGYASVAALRADLVRFLTGQLPQSEAILAQAHQRRSWVAAAALVLLLGAGLLALNWRAVTTYATWGSPIVAENFDNESWKARWGSRGRWKQQDGRILSAAEFDCALICKQRLTPPVAIEYTGRFASDVQPGDLSIWWCEDDPFQLRAGEDIDNAKAWYVQAGAYGNSWCTIWQTPSRIRSQVNNLVLEPDRDYRFRVEIDHDRLTMWIDGRQVMEHRESFPIGSGHLALYTWDPGKSFDDVRIWQQPLPERVSPLAIGDEAYRAGRFADAAAIYGRIATSHREGSLRTEALYFQGLAYYQLGSRAIAKKTWQDMPDGVLRSRAESLAIEDLVANNDLVNAVNRFTTLWRQQPAIHDDLRQRWQICGQNLRTARPLRTADMETWIALREKHFANDAPSRWLVAEMFNTMARWDETLRRYPDERRAVALAMLALGRNAEVLAADWSLPSERTFARLGLGDVEAALASTETDQNTRLDLLCKTGRAAEAAEIDTYPAQLYLGRIDLLSAQHRQRDRINAALIAAGRLEEAAGPGLPGLPQSGNDRTALLLLGRLDPAERLLADTHLPRMLALIAAGHLDEARTMRASYRRQLQTINHRSYSAWFGVGVGAALVDIELGNPAALRQALEAGSRITSGWGARCSMVCAAALDPARDAALAAMPWRTEADAWLLVAQALRAELAGDRPTALKLWQTYQALPMVDRLLEGHLPSVDLEAIVQWRVVMLSR